MLLKNQRQLPKELDVATPGRESTRHLGEKGWGEGGSKIEKEWGGTFCETWKGKKEKGYKGPSRNQNGRQ